MAKSEEKDTMKSFVIITGGTGFLGVNLILHLLKQKTPPHIIVMDNYVSSSPEALMCALENHPYKDHVHNYMTSTDICDKKEVTEALYHSVKCSDPSQANIKEIYHLASIASPPRYKNHPIATMDVSYIGTKNMLHLAIKFGAKLLFTSTSEVYGDAKEHPQNEEYYGNVNCYGERSCYDEGKRGAEALILSYRKVFPSLNTRIVRIFNTYGPFMDMEDGRIVTEIARAGVSGDPITVYGNGEQTRSFCYVDDLLKMMMVVMNSDVSAPVNIGNDAEISINEIVETGKTIMEKHTEEWTSMKPYSVKYEPLEKDDPKMRRPELTKIKTMVKEATGKEMVYTPLKEGLYKTLGYFDAVSGDNFDEYMQWLDTVVQCEAEENNGLWDVGGIVGSVFALVSYLPRIIGRVLFA